MRRIVLIVFFCIPALFLQAKSQKPVIILDPGHGGKDQGAHVRNILEKNLTLRTSYLLKKELETLGYSVILTRARDVFISLDKRVEIANQRRGALFLSIHYNSSTAPSAKGIEIYYCGKGESGRANQSKQLAHFILNHMEQMTTCPSRGIKRGNFQVIRQTEIPSVLIEAGFLTNAGERILLGQPAYLEKLVKGIALGVEEFEKSVLGAS